MNKTGPRPIARCPLCGRTVAVRIDGTLREHPLRRPGVNQCLGSGERATTKAKL